MYDPQSRHTHREAGQTLTIVALALFGLLGATALAVDVGMWYAERRQMQNAADAGALAGAREMCFNDAYSPDTTGIATSAATTQAQMNGAIDVVAEVWNEAGTLDTTGNVVYVEARKPAESFFARVLGVSEVTVGARAAAACGVAASGCDFLPVTFRQETWEDIPCGSYFFVWDDANANKVNDQLCECCDCSSEDMVGVKYGSPRIGPGERAWLRLRDVPEPFPPSPCEGNCGAAALGCWLSDPFHGRVELGDCVPGNPGVAASVFGDFSVWEGTGTTQRVIIYDPARSCDRNLPGCDDTAAWYPYTGLGCIQIVKVFDTHDKITLPVRTPTAEPYPAPTATPNPACKDVTCPKNAFAIFVRKVCPCTASSCGGTSGAPMSEQYERAASLISVPGS